MASKDCKKKSRNWTNEETSLFVEILTDEEYNFAECLEKRALKRFANEEVYQEILKIFNYKLREEGFMELNQKNFGKGKYDSLYLDTKKLQVKYNALKKKWRDIKDRPMKGSGLAPEKHPDWYENLNAVLGDTNSNLEEVVSNPLDTSYAKEHYENEDGESSSSEEETDQREGDNRASDNTGTRDKRLIVKPHQKRKVVRSQTQALSHLAGGMTQLIQSHAKRHKSQMDFERERDRAFMEFKREEAERNRQHELEMAKIFSSALTSFRSAPRALSPEFQQTNFYSSRPSSMFSNPLNSLTRPQCNMQMSPVFPPSSTPCPRNMNSNTFDDSQNWD